MQQLLSSENVFALLLSLPSFLAAITIHEFAHAWMGHRLGDDTARRQGRLTLDPMAHLDPLGSLMFIVTQLSGYGLGWAKPVQTDPRNFAHPRRGMMLVAIAGPISNLLQIPFWFGALWLFMHVVPMSVLVSNDPNSWVRMVIIALSNGIIVNAVLAAFNMIPFPPLDGHYILEGLGPPFVTDIFNAIRPYGFMLIFMLSFIPQSMKVLDAIFEPVYQVAVALIGIALGTR